MWFQFESLSFLYYLVYRKVYRLQKHPLGSTFFGSQNSLLSTEGWTPGQMEYHKKVSLISPKHITLAAHDKLICRIFDFAQKKVDKNQFKI